MPRASSARCPGRCSCSSRRCASPLLGRAFDVIADRILLMSGRCCSRSAGSWRRPPRTWRSSWPRTACFLALGLQLDVRRHDHGDRAALRRGDRSGPRGSRTRGRASAWPGAAARRRRHPGARLAGRGRRSSRRLSLRGGAVRVADDERRRRCIVSAGRGNERGRDARAARRERHGAVRRAAGLHETSAPGAIAASQEPLPAGSRSRPDALRRTMRTRRFLILLVGAVGIGCIDEGIFQMSPRHAVAQGMARTSRRSLLAAPVLRLRRRPGRRRRAVRSVRAPLRRPALRRADRRRGDRRSSPPPARCWRWRRRQRDLRLRHRGDDRHPLGRLLRRLRRPQLRRHLRHHRRGLSGRRHHRHERRRRSSTTGWATTGRSTAWPWSRSLAWSTALVVAGPRRHGLRKRLRSGRSGADPQRRPRSSAATPLPAGSWPRPRRHEDRRDRRRARPRSSSTCARRQVGARRSSPGAVRRSRR